MTTHRNRAGRPKGYPKTGGRQRGTPNKATREVKAMARSIVEDSQVQAKLLGQARKGSLAPPLMVMLFHYAYGKPKDTVAVEGGLEALIVRIIDPSRPSDGDPSAATDASMRVALH